MAMCGSKNEYKIDIYLQDIGLHAQNVLTYSRLNCQCNWGSGLMYDVLTMGT